MIVKVKYFNEEVNGYGGQEYTYITNLPLQQFTKVIAPTYKGDNKALVTQIDLPESTISPEWADRVREIKEYDNGEG